MKQFIYSSHIMGLAEWPSGTLRLEGIEVTEDPKAADVYVVPGNIRIFETTPGSGILDHVKLYRLPYLKGNEARTAFFDCSDDFKQPINLPIIFLHCDVRKWMLPYDPNTIQMAWPVNPKGDLDQCVEIPSEGYLYDVGFVGWNSGLARKVSAMSCKTHPGIQSDITMYSDFYGHLKDTVDGVERHAEDTAEGIRRRADFIRNLKESRIILCPESIPGVLPYRFFEACAAGRYPLLVGRDYILPFADHVPYDDFMSHIDTDEATEAGDVVAEIRSRHTDKVFKEKGELARKCWLEWMDGRIWPKLMAFAVAEKLKAMGLTTEEAVMCR